jgi:hypothetical protein
VREQAPLLAPTLQDVEDGVQDLTKIVDPRACVSFGSWHVRLDVVPLGIREICWIRGFLMHARVQNYHPRTTFHTVSLSSRVNKDKRKDRGVKHPGPP